MQTILALILPFSSIVYSAHVGGLAVGLAAALIWKRLVMRKHYGYYWRSLRSWLWSLSPWRASRGPPPRTPQAATL